MYISREKCCEEMIQVRIRGAQPLGSGPDSGNSQALGPEACSKKPNRPVPQEDRGERTVERR